MGQIDQMQTVLNEIIENLSELEEDRERLRVLLAAGSFYDLAVIEGGYSEDDEEEEEL